MNRLRQMKRCLNRIKIKRPLRYKKIQKEYKGNSDIVKQRMDIMTKTNDGFIVSEKDLELRGSGEFFGTKQHGLPEFKIANLFEDIETLKSVQSVAISINIMIK